MIIFAFVMMAARMCLVSSQLLFPAFVAASSAQLLCSICLFRVYGSGLAHLVTVAPLLDYFGSRKNANLPGYIAHLVTVMVVQPHLAPFHALSLMWRLRIVTLL